MAEDTSVKFGVKAGWRAQSVWSEMLAEFVGCFVLLAFGAGCVAVAVVGLTESHRTMVIFQGAGGWMVIVWGWAFAVAMAFMWQAGSPERTSIRQSPWHLPSRVISPGEKSYPTG